MKTKHSLLIASCALLFAFAPVSTASAQAIVDSAPSGMLAGLIGEEYAGFEFGYMRHHESAPRIMRRWGFAASRPMPDHRDLDGIFRYNYTRGNTLGANGDQHDFLAGLAGYMRGRAATLFIEGDIGWAWAKATGVRRNSFQYQLRAGVEMMISPYLSLTPSVAFYQAPRFHEQAFRFGAKAAWRIHPRFVATLGMQIDEENNVESTIGILRRY